MIITCIYKSSNRPGTYIIDGYWDECDDNSDRYWQHEIRSYKDEEEYNIIESIVKEWKNNEPPKTALLNLRRHKFYCSMFADDIVRCLASMALKNTLKGIAV